MNIIKIDNTDTIYLSGPMGGFHDNNQAMFHGIQCQLEDQFKCQVINPANFHRAGWKREDYLRWDCIQLCSGCTGVVFLPGWRQSDGAWLEHVVARKTRLKRFGSDFRPLVDGVIIGLTGYAGVGKDTIANMICGFKVKIADKIKEKCADLCLKKFAIDSFTEVRQDKEVIRDFLVEYGLAMRIVQEDYWLNHIEESGELYDKSLIVVADVRYPNEANWIRRNGGIVVRLDRDGITPANDHEKVFIDAIQPDIAISCHGRNWGWNDVQAIANYQFSPVRG